MEAIGDQRQGVWDLSHVTRDGGCDIELYPDTVYGPYVMELNWLPLPDVVHVDEGESLLEGMSENEEESS